MARPKVASPIPPSVSQPPKTQPPKTQPPTTQPSKIGLPFPADVHTDAAGRGAALELINQQVKCCTLCPVLVRNRTQTVFGVGHVKPRVLFFGEAPGADEDRLGEPMVGRAGQLLTKIIEACTWRREDVYILNTLKCRPPDNRPPEPDELANCRPFWERQLEILQPQYIVCVGASSAQTLLETTEAVGKLRQRFFTYRGSRVVVTYHPSYLLRNPSAKRHVWDDMLMLLKEMGITLPVKADG